VSAVAFRPKPVHARELVLSVRAALEKAQALRSLSRAQRMISVWTEWLRLVDALLSMPGPTRLPSGVLSGIARRENSPRRSNEPGDWSTPARTLSLREREALFAFTSGLRPRQIAKTLGVTIHTARAHRKAVMTPIPGTPFPCESLTGTAQPGDAPTTSDSSVCWADWPNGGLQFHLYGETPNGGGTLSVAMYALRLIRNGGLYSGDGSYGFSFSGDTSQPPCGYSASGTFFQRTTTP
jgi:DNA-binding CsgD family transcriptional regulator